MLNKNAKLEFDCPNCKHKISFTVGQVQRGEPITCQNCQSKVDTSELQKSLSKVERDLKNLGKQLNKTININLKF